MQLSFSQTLSFGERTSVLSSSLQFQDYMQNALAAQDAIHFKESIREIDKNFSLLNFYLSNIVSATHFEVCAIL